MRSRGMRSVYIPYWLQKNFLGRRLPFVIAIGILCIWWLAALKRQLDQQGREQVYDDGLEQTINENNEERQGPSHLTHVNDAISLSTDEEKVPSVPEKKTENVPSFACHNMFASPGSEPAFMVLGVQKGGSTAIYNYLARHGQVLPAVCKEIHFFDRPDKFAQGKEYYLRHFPDITWLGNHGNHVITGEATPSYIRDPKIAATVKSWLPQIKLIVSMREPAMRFRSHWLEYRQMPVRKEIGGFTCKRAWRDAVDEIERCMANNTLQLCHERLHENGVMRGIYLPQIQAWLKQFPAEQLLVIQAESLYANVNRTMQRMARFLGLRPYTDNELASFREARIGTYHHEDPMLSLCDSVADTMPGYYAKFNRLLKPYLSKTFPDFNDHWIDGIWSGDTT